MSLSSADVRNLINEREAAIRQPGNTLFYQGRYEILRVLGEGGMGITCLAHEISAGDLRRPVVLKFVKDSLAPRHLSQFLNEAQLSILFNHPNLLPVYRLESETIVLGKSGPQPGLQRPYEHTVHYTVMQYIDGWNMRQIVNRLRSLKLIMNHDIAMYAISRICRGLHYVHQYRDENGSELGLVHRDVSPENILIDRFGRIKVADFGITKAFKQARGKSSFHPGKLLYSSPEQLDGKTLDHRSDIYGVGLLMYFLFTDTDRFGLEGSLSQARERIRRKMRRPCQAELKQLNPRLAQICTVCLREDPAERYQSCEDLATDLDIFFKDSQKVVTNDVLEEYLADLFSQTPTFVSRRFIPLTGTPRLEHPPYTPDADARAEEVPEQLHTVRISAD